MSAPILCRENIPNTLKKRRRLKVKQFFNTATETNNSFVVVKVKVFTRRFLLLVLHAIKLVDARAVVGGVAPKGDVEHLEEGIHAWDECLGRVGRSLDTGRAIVDDDTVS